MLHTIKTSNMLFYFLKPYNEILSQQQKTLIQQWSRDDDFITLDVT